MANQPIVPTLQWFYGLEQPVEIFCHHNSNTGKFDMVMKYKDTSVCERKLNYVVKFGTLVFIMKFINLWNYIQNNF